MYTALLIIIYIVYIGLGIPDSSFGSALPAMWKDLNLPLTFASIISIIISISTLISSAISAFLIAKLKTGKITFFATLLTALSLFGFTHANSFWAIILLSIPLGLGAGSIDTALNNFIALNYSSSQMSFLHCFYGVGVSLTPFIFSFTLKNDNDWRLGYLIIFIIQISLTLIALLSLPLWKKVEGNDKKGQPQEVKLLSLSQMAKTPSLLACWGAFFFTCALEFTCDNWGTSYLVSCEGLTEAMAARFLTFYFIGIAGGRFLSGLLNIKIDCKKVIYIGYLIVFLGIVTLFLPLPAGIKGCALFLIGLGNGPSFPNLTFLLPANFGKKGSQSLVSAQMVVSNAGILIVPPLFGVIAQNFSLGLFPYFILLTFVLMVVCTILYDKLPKKNFDLE